MGAWTSKTEPADEPSRLAAVTPAASTTGDPKRPARVSLRVRLLVGLPLLVMLVATILVSTALIHYTVRFPDPMALRKRDGAPIVRVLARDGTVLTERGQGGGFIPLDLMPRQLIDAVVATEDRRFFDHVGLDPFGLARAMFANLRAGRYAQGGSTLTQQLAKNLFLTSDRTMGRKVEELVLALWLEVRLSKQDILELYLNRVYFGGGAYGVEAASHRYFDKGARKLNLAEAAVLAGLLKAPSKYSPAASPGLARSRARSVLRKMRDAGLIDEAAEQRAAQMSVRFADPSAGREATGLEYAIEFVLERLPPLAGTGHREIIVETTFDAALQRHAQAVVERTLATEGIEAGAAQAAVMILDTDGGIRAMVGGRSFQQSQFNRAVKAQRQPGSAFKPVVYLTAVEQGATPDTMVLDMPLNIGGWTPRNEGGQHRGSITLRQALAHSVNTVAARLQQDAGTNRVIATARRLGIKSELRAGPSLALGASEVTLIELTGAYGVLASGGLSVEPHAIRKVRTSGKDVLYARPATRPRMIVAPDHVGSMSSMLNTAMISGTGRRAALPRFPAAGKTGTTQDFRDAWFVGYTAHLVGGVWVGNDGGEPMHRVTGGSLSATIWRDVMMEAHQRLLPTPLPGTEHVRPEAPQATAAGIARAARVGPRQANPEPVTVLPKVEAARTTPTPSAHRVAKQRRPEERVSPARPGRKLRVPLQPRESIDADLIAKAAAPTPQQQVGSEFDKDGLQRALGGTLPERRMGLGVRP